MKHRILTILLLAVLLLTALPLLPSSAVAPAQTAGSDIRVMSANLLAEFPSWSGGNAPRPTSERIADVEKMLNENAPMIVGSQEVSPTWYTAFTQLDQSKWAWLEEPDVAGYSYYNYVPNVGKALNTIIYRKDLLELKAHGVEAYEKRTNGHCIVWGVFTIKASGKQFVFISTHWTPPGGSSHVERLAQAEQLSKKVNELKHIYGNTVICTGDFNSTADSQEFRRFIVNSNSIESRAGAAKRGDSLAKIDHITATAGASFTYHTICYEANGAYNISDHPFAVADVKLDSALMFDFTDTNDARMHYKQGNYRHNSFDYHNAYWVSGNTSNQTINKTSGALTFNVTSSGNPFVMPTTVATTDPATASALNYDPQNAEIARIRFKLTGCAQIDTATNPKLTFSAATKGSSKWVSNAKSYTLSSANGKYLTLDISLTAGGVKSLTQMETFKLSFDNIKDGSVEIDYIYVGKKNAVPLNSALLFDYSNTKGDETRYNGSAYGKLNYDTPTNGYWTSAGYGATNAFSIDNTAGTLSLNVSNTNVLGPIIATSPKYATYDWSANGASLNYTPSNAEVAQVRFMLTDCTAVSGQTPRVLLMYGGMYDGAFDGNNYENLATYTVSDGKYIVVTIPLSDTFRSASTITKLGLRFQYIESAASGKVTLDYLYVGPKNGVPIQHVFTHTVTKPTCTAQGYTTHTCNTCKYSYQDSPTAATGHNYSSAVTTVPTQSTKGVLTYTCKNNSAHTYTEELQPLHKELFFDFTNNEAAKTRYNNYTYRLNNFDLVELWKVYNSTNTTKVEIANGNLTSTGAISEGNSYNVGPVTNGTEGAYKSLYYVPGSNDYCTVRMRIDNVDVSEAKDGTFYMFVFYDGLNAYREHKCTVEYEKCNNGYFTFSFPLPYGTSVGGSQAGSFDGTVDFISGLIPQLRGFKGASNNTTALTYSIDYIHIGDKNSRPIAEHLLFDFKNDTAAKARYALKTYGETNFDLGDNWRHDGGANATVASGALTGKVSAFRTAVNGGSSLASCTLQYTPHADDYLQVRFKIAVPEKDKVKVKLYYLTTGASAWASIDSTTVSIKDATYAVASIPLAGTSFVNAQEIAGIQLAFNECAGESLSIDYIYIGAEKGMPTQHSYQKVVTAPTCTAKGYTTYTCSICAKSYIADYVAAKGHTEVIDKAVAATCTTAGKTEGKHCSVCNTVIVKQTSIPATGHTEVIDKAVAATCTTAGKTEGKHCSVCNAVIVKQTSIPATGHTEVIDKAVAATCTTAGKTEGKHCSVCNAVIVKQTSIPATGHTEVIDKAVAATCTTAGKTEGKHCSVCNAVIVKQSTVAALGHDLTVYESDSATQHKLCCSRCDYFETSGHTWKFKNIDSAEVHNRYCKYCGYNEDKNHTEFYQYHENTDGKTHSVSCPHCGWSGTEAHDWVLTSTTNATCTTSGAKHYTCSKKGYTKDGQYTDVDCTATKTETIPALGHSYSYTDNGETHSKTCSCGDKVTEAHTFVNGKCICGAKEVIDPIYDDAVKFSHSLTLENDISINFIGLGSALIGYDSFYLECKVPVYNGNELVGYETVTIEPVYNGKNYECTLLGITAKMMNDEIEAVFHMTKDGQEYYSRTDVYSVAEYAYGKLDSVKATDTAELKAICANLLRYGSMAQVQFGYRTDALVDANMTDAHKAFLTDLSTVEMKDYRKQLSDLDTVIVPWKSTTLELGNKVIMCLIANLANYSGDPSELTMRLSFTDANGAVITEERPLALYNPEALTYAVSYDGLRATEMRSVVSAAIYRSGERVSKTVEYSIESYGARSKDPAMQELCRAMLAYGDSANIFFAN